MSNYIEINIFAFLEGTGGPRLETSISLEDYQWFGGVLDASNHVKTGKTWDFAYFPGLAVDFTKFHMISYISLESMVWGATGPLQTINIPLEYQPFQHRG